MGWLKICAASLLILVVACGGGSSGAVPTLTPTPEKSTTGSALPPAAADTTPEALPVETATPRTGGAQDAANRLFVDLGGGSDAGDGKRNAPLLTLGAALNRAASLGTAEIFVSAGQINGTHNVSTAVRMYGGFDAATWDRKPGQVTSITSSGYALNITGDGTLVDGFTLQTTGLVGPNSVAVLVSGASGVRLTNNTIIATNGAAGAAGANGLTGEAGEAGEDGEDAGDCPPNKSGGAGGSGANGTGGVGGEGTPKSGIAGDPGSNGGGAGGSRGNTGQDGKPGGVGDNGTADLEPGSGGEPFGILETTGYEPAIGKDGSGTTGDGKAGGGGGGGGGGGRSNSPCGAGGGGGGAGGIGSKDHGKGGLGGGASIGVLVIDGDVTVVGSTIRTGAGGAGGRGGDGGTGGPGGAGGAGGERNVTQGAGGAGGAGGRGGDSAPGGGGGGGPSIAVLGNYNASMNVSATNFETGDGGAGGAGGAPTSGGQPGVTGATGFSRDLYQADEPEEEEAP